MNNIYKIFSLALVAFPLGLTSCSNEIEPEIVESNYTYSIDPTKTEVDMPEEFKYSDGVIAQILGGEKEARFRATVTPVSKFVVGDKQFSFSLVTNKVFEESALYTLEPDIEKTEAYAASHQGLKALPASEVTIPEGITFDKGTNTTDTYISLKEEFSYLDFTSQDKGYVLVLHLKSSNPEQYKVGAKGAYITVLVTPSYTNVVPEEKAQEHGKFKVTVFDSFPKEKSWSSTHWSDLIDGFAETGHSFWGDANEELYLTVDLGSNTEFSGFRLTPFEQWGSVSYPSSGVLYTSEDGTNFKMQGAWNITRSLSTLQDVASFMLFAPVKARYVKISFDTTYTYLGELEFFGPGAV